MRSLDLSVPVVSSQELTLDLGVWNAATLRHGCINRRMRIGRIFKIITRFSCSCLFIERRPSSFVSRGAPCGHLEQFLVMAVALWVELPDIKSHLVFLVILQGMHC